MFVKQRAGISIKSKSAHSCCPAEQPLAVATSYPTSTLPDYSFIFVALNAWIPPDSRNDLPPLSHLDNKYEKIYDGGFLSGDAPKMMSTSSTA